MVNSADYTEDLSRIEDLLTIVLNLQEWLEQNPVRYPLAIKAYNTILYGLIPQIRLEDGTIVTADSPCGGLIDAYDILDQAIEALDLEVFFERGCYDESLSDVDGEGE